MMPNCIGDEMLERVDSTYYYPVPYGCIGDGGWELTETVRGSA